MPCTYTGSLEGDRALAAKEALDKRERMLCALCGYIEKQYGEAALNTVLRTAATEADGLPPQAIVSWWKKHKKAEGR